MTFDLDYWLGHCEGFLVDSPDGRVRIVEEVVFSSRLDRPEALSVRSTHGVSRCFVVLVDEIGAMLPSAEQIVLRARPRRAGPASPELRSRPVRFGRLERRRELSGG